MAETGLESLLPLRAITFTLRFGDPATLSFFPQTAISGFVRRLLGDATDYDYMFTTDALETAQIAFGESDPMRFTVIALPGAERRISELWLRLGESGRAPVHWDPPMPLRDNVWLASALDGFTGNRITSPLEAGLYGQDQLTAEMAQWRGCRDLYIRLRSPLRIYKPKGERSDARKEWRFCRDNRHLDGSVWFDRLHDSLADLVRRRGGTFPTRTAAPAARSHPDVFWCDANYGGGDGSPKPDGGLLGNLHLILDADLDDLRLAQLVLGQYLGIGHRRAFGQGRYFLIDPDGHQTFQHAPPARRFLDQVVAPSNLTQAWEVIAENSRLRRAEPNPLPPRGDDNAAPSDPPCSAADRDPGPDLDRLQRLGEHLSRGSYQVPALTGWSRRDPDGSPRALAVPPFIDRVAQRAVVQVLGPTFDAFMDASSYGYRIGRSRFNARDEISRLYEKGYRWVFESDIHSFFDSVDWRRLRTRLEGLLGPDLIVDLLLAWVAAPVEHRGRLVQRTCGLPQGAPVSPLLANLMLDDFDSDLRDQGLRLVRFADDFVILAKSREAAEAAGAAAQEALDDLGLKLKPSKTRVVHFSQGFKYLGMLFVDGLSIEVKREAPARGSPIDDTPHPVSWLAAYEAEVAANPTVEGDGEGEGESSAQVQTNGDNDSALRSHRTVALGHYADRGTTLFVTGTPAMLVTRAGRLLVERDDTVLHDCAWTQLESVCLFGNHQVTTQALHSAMQRGVPVHYATSYGHWVGATWSAAASPAAAELWLAQERLLADPEAALAAARAVVAARLRHQHEVLRTHEQTAAIRGAMTEIAAGLRHLDHAADRDTLNGLEGQAARAYFGALREIVPEVFGFAGRNRRPPRDPFNALLSLGYSMLAVRTATLLQLEGLLPWRGFYHQPHGTHPVLASDLMEPFRHEVERVALRMLTQRRLHPEDFEHHGSACMLTDAGRRLYLGALAETFDKTIKARGDNTAHSLLEHMQRQNRRLIAWIIGTACCFEPWRLR